MGKPDGSKGEGDDIVDQPVGADTFGLDIAALDNGWPNPEEIDPTMLDWDQYSFDPSVDTLLGDELLEIPPSLPGLESASVSESGLLDIRKLTSGKAHLDFDELAGKRRFRAGHLSEVSDPTSPSYNYPHVSTLDGIGLYLPFLPDKIRNAVSDLVAFVTRRRGKVVLPRLDDDIRKDSRREGNGE